MAIIQRIYCLLAIIEYLFEYLNKISPVIRTHLLTEIGDNKSGLTINDILIVLYGYTIMSKLFNLHSDIFLECDEYHQISEYLNDKISPKEQEFLTQAIAFYEKHRHDSDDSI